MRPIVTLLALCAMGSVAFAAEDAEAPLMLEIPDSPVLPSKDVKPYAPLPDTPQAVTPEQVVEEGKGSLVSGPVAAPAPKFDDRLPGGPGECALEGKASGPSGCSILKQNMDHHEWPSQ